MPQIGFAVPTNRMTSTSVGQLKTTFCWFTPENGEPDVRFALMLPPLSKDVTCGEHWGTAIESDSQWECFKRMKEIKSCTSFIVTGSLSPTICNCLEKHWKTSQEHYQLVRWRLSLADAQQKQTSKPKGWCRMMNQEECQPPALLKWGVVSNGCYALHFGWKKSYTKAMVKKDFELLERQNGNGLQLAIRCYPNPYAHRHNTKDIKDCIPKASSSFEMELVF